MIRVQTIVLSCFLLTVCNITEKAPVIVAGKSFEYELPNRTVTICPTSSLIALECPQSSASYADHRQWQGYLPQYLISIDFIRSYPSRLGHDPTSCQADLSHPCNNYDLRYINTLCNGKPYCPDIPAYQVRDRSLCAFKAITEIGYHCVPTWHLRDIQTKCDICKNGSLTNDYGFIYSRNYPSQTTRIPCFTTIYARPNHKTILYFVNGELNHDQLRIESISSEGITILNITLNGNQTTQRLAVSTYEMKITFLPSHVYSHQPTYYLLYFYTVPYCSFTEPCPTLPHTTRTTTMIIPTTMTTTTSRMRFQSIGWTRIPNIWIVVPIILAYILILLLIILLALFFQRRRKQRKALTAIGTSAMSVRTPVLTPMPPPIGNGGSMVSRSTYRRTNTGEHLEYPMHSDLSFARNMDRYHRSSRSDFDLHQSTLNGVDYRYQTGAPYPYTNQVHSGMNHSGRMMDYQTGFYSPDQRRRPLPKSFSDCNLCKRQVFLDEAYNQRDDNWRLENSSDHRRSLSSEPKVYRERIQERLSVRQVPADVNPMNSSHGGHVEYSTVIPRHQRIGSESARSNGFAGNSLPFEYIPNESASNVRTVEYKRNENEERFIIGNNESSTDDYGSTNFSVKFYQRDDENERDFAHRLDRCLHEAREVQEMSMRMTEQQQQQHYVNRHRNFNQQRRFDGNPDM